MAACIRSDQELGWKCGVFMHLGCQKNTHIGQRVWQLWRLESEIKLSAGQLSPEAPPGRVDGHPRFLFSWLPLCLPAPLVSVGPQLFLLRHQPDDIRPT